MKHSDIAKANTFYYNPYLQAEINILNRYRHIKSIIILLTFVPSLYIITQNFSESIIRGIKIS
jgi:hypothetical protein